MADPNHSGGQMPPLGASAPLVPPLYTSSVYTLPDLDSLDEILDDNAPGFIYARDGHPNAAYLASQLTALESAGWAVVCSSGMAAISAVLLSLLKQGDRVVASSSLYGRTIQLLSQELGRLGIETTFVDFRDLPPVKEALVKPARVLLAETISNPLLHVVDIEQLANLAHERGSILVVDNTFATPVLARPLEWCADLVVESLTKMIGGHGDVTLGAVCGHGADQQHISQVVSIWGLASNPFDCWLASRGLATLPLRIRTASANAANIAEWMVDLPGVKAVYYPGMQEGDDYELACRYLEGGFGNMLSFELSGGRQAVNRFMRAAKSIPFSPSLGSTSTTCSHPATTSHRYVHPAERRRQGIADGLVRLSVGIEPLQSIKQELTKGLS